MANDYLINNTRIKNPHTFSIERYKLTKSGRIASGLMTMDVIAKKKTFQIHYDVLEGPDLDTIINLLDSDNAFYSFKFTERGQECTYTVYAGAIKYEKFRSDGVTYWKNVEFQLIEQ